MASKLLYYDTPCHLTPLFLAPVRRPALVATVSIMGGGYFESALREHGGTWPRLRVPKQMPTFVEKLDYRIALGIESD